MRVGGSCGKNVTVLLELGRQYKLVFICQTVFILVLEYDNANLDLEDPKIPICRFWNTADNERMFPNLKKLRIGPPLSDTPEQQDKSKMLLEKICASMFQVHENHPVFPNVKKFRPENRLLDYFQMKKPELFAAIKNYFPNLPTRSGDEAHMHSIRYE